jgi:high-affinity Fe2+/Pb2+ permease
LALIVMTVAAIGTLWLGAAMAFATYFGIVELTGREHIGWAVAGALLTGVVVWVGFMRGIWRELLSAPDRWRQKRHNKS